MSGSNVRTIEQVQHVGNMRWDAITGTWVPITADDLAGVGSTATAINDGVDGAIKATVLDLTNSNPLTSAIVDANGDQISSFGGGTQYTEGDTDASITGTATLMEVAGNALAPIQGSVTDGQLVNLGANNDVTVTGSVTANGGTNLNTSLLALEGGGNLATIAAKDFATQTTLALIKTDADTLVTRTPVQGQTTMAASSPVVIASDQSAVPISGTVTASGYADLVTSGSVTNGNDVFSVATSGYAGLGVDISGTFTGTITFKVSSNGGSSYAATYVMNRALFSLVSTTTATGSFISLNLAGADHFQVFLAPSPVPTGSAVIRYTQTVAPYPNIILGGSVGSTSPSLAGYLGANWTLASILEPLQVAITPPGSSDFGLTVRQVPEISSRSDTYTVEGNGTAVNVSTHSRQYFAIQVVCSTTTALAWDIVLEGSLNGTNYDTILEHTQANGDAKIIWLNEAAPCLYFRSRCKSLMLGDSTGVVATIMGRY